MDKAASRRSAVPKHMPSIKIRQNVSLAPLTTFRIGGPAKFFCTAKSEEGLLEALDFAKSQGLKFFILGGGSNILFSDKGFDGLVIKLGSSKQLASDKGQGTSNKGQITRDKGQGVKRGMIDCWAGESLTSLVNLAKENAFTGLEWAAGIPGTVGGAIQGNAGAFGGQMADSVESVRVADVSGKKTKVKEYKKRGCWFGYRDSFFKKNPQLVILSVRLKLEKGRQQEIGSRMDEVLKKRRSLPKGSSAGSFFQNPVVDNPEVLQEFEKETGNKPRDGKVPAGWLIEEAGFKGKKIGGVMVSDKHANFIINTGNGTAEDVVILAGIIKQKLREHYDVPIKEEIMYVGF